LTTDDEIRERLRAARAKYAEPEPDPGPAFDPSLIPTEDLLGPRRLDSDLTKLKERIDREVNVFDIYDRFMPPHKVRAAPRAGQRESIKFSCPDPSHPDAHPSAWTNIDGLWYCEPCGARGDKYTIAAIGEGLDIKRQFREVCTRIADAFGIDYPRLVSAPIIYTPVEPKPDDEPEVLTEAAPRSSYMPLVPWRDLFPPGTFMRIWMDAMCKNDLPEEYHNWLGFQMIGLALGRDAWLIDGKNVFGNLYICLYGPSGIGKSRAIGPMKELLRRALPYDRSDPLSKGAYVIRSLESSQALVDAFYRPIIDPSTSAVIGHGSVRGLVYTDEFALMMTKGERTSGIKVQLTDLYDHSEAATTGREKGAILAEDAFCCLLATTQPGAVGEYLRNVDVQSGFANRIAFIMGHHKKLVARGGFTYDLDEAAHELARIRSWAAMPGGRQVRFDVDGGALYDHYFETMLVPAKMDPDAPLFVRIDLTIKKLILLICANEHSDYATAEIVEKAMAYFEYLRYCYQQFGDSITLSIEEEITDWIISAIQRNVSRTGKPPTARDLKRDKPKRYSTKQVNEGLRTLRGIGRVFDCEVPTTAKGGRPTVRWQLAELMDLDDK
jgi:hypothetical protein